MSEDKIGPIHPGEHLLEFLGEFDLDAQRLARELHISPQSIEDIIDAKKAITADTALRLGRYFGTTAQFWMNLQIGYDLAVARQMLDIETIHPLAA